MAPERLALRSSGEFGRCLIREGGKWGNRCKVLVKGVRYLYQHRNLATKVVPHDAPRGVQPIEIVTGELMRRHRKAIQAHHLPWRLLVSCRHDTVCRRIFQKPTQPWNDRLIVIIAWSWLQ